MNIGNWVRRRGKWHLVESIVAGDAVTKCGRRMKDPGLEVRDEMPLTRMIGQPQLCKAGCEREETWADDFAAAVDANEDAFSDTDAVPSE